MKDIHKYGIKCYRNKVCSSWSFLAVADKHGNRCNCKKNKVNFDCIQKFFYLASLKEVSVHIKNKNNNQKGKENKSYFINYSWFNNFWVFPDNTKPQISRKKIAYGKADKIKNNQYKIMYSIEIYNEEALNYNNYKSVNSFYQYSY